MQLYLIRHAQSVNNASGEDAPHVPDCPLTDLGRQQARLVAEWLQGQEVTRLYCSPMQRALQTTLPIMEALGLAPTVWVDLHEHGGAMWDRGPDDLVNLPGLTRAEMQAQFAGYTLPDKVTAQGWWRHRWGFEPPEAIRARGQRVAAELLELAEQNGDARLALVSHGGFMDTLLRTILELHHERTIYFRHNNTGVTKLNYWEWSGARNVMLYHNRTAHLPPDMLS